MISPIAKKRARDPWGWANQIFRFSGGAYEEKVRKSKETHEKKDTHQYVKKRLQKKRGLWWIHDSHARTTGEGRRDTFVPGRGITQPREGLCLYTGTKGTQTADWGGVGEVKPFIHSRTTQRPGGGGATFSEKKKEEKGESLGHKKSKLEERVP